MTLAPWGSAGDRIPLKIAVEDRDYQSPFSLAVLRGHHDVARAILQISFAQYHPETDEEKARYRLRNAGDDYDDDDNDDDDAAGDDDIPVYKEIVDAKFTIENIGEVSIQVKSKISPLDFMFWSCSGRNYYDFCAKDKKLTYGVDNRAIKGQRCIALIGWAIARNDKDMFSFLLDLDVEWTDRLRDKSDDTSAIPSFYHADFERALKWGRLDLMAELIKHGGAGMDLDSLVKKSGVKFVEKPKYYQGLSVRFPRLLFKTHVLIQLTGPWRKTR